MFTFLYITSHLFWAIFFFFFNDTATTEIYTLSLHDALPIWAYAEKIKGALQTLPFLRDIQYPQVFDYPTIRSEEHTSELQSHSDLVCRLLLEKKKMMDWYCLISMHRIRTDKRGLRTAIDGLA